MLELLVDLVGTCLCHRTIPITLLHTLAMVCTPTLVLSPCITTLTSLQTFDTNTTFSQKHKDEPLPTRRVYTLNDEVFVRNSSQKGSYGWLRSIIQRVSIQWSDPTVRRSISSSSSPRMV